MIGKMVSFSLDLPADYSLFLTVQVLRRTARNIVDQWVEDGFYVRGLHTSSGDCLVTVRQRADQAEVNVTGPAVQAELVEEITISLHRILGLDVNISGAGPAVAFHPAFAAMARRMKGMRPPRFPTLFESIASVVPFQQLSLEAGMSLMCCLVKRYGRCLIRDGLRAWIFPGPGTIAELPVEQIRTCGFSLAKAQTLQRIARLIADGEVSESDLADRPTSRLVERLDDLPGIGPWSAAVIALRGFGRLDIFPSGDAGVHRALGDLLGQPTPLEEEAERTLVNRLGSTRGLLYYYALGSRLARAGLLAELHER